MQLLLTSFSSTEHRHQVSPCTYIHLTCQHESNEFHFEIEFSHCLFFIKFFSFNKSGNAVISQNLLFMQQIENLDFLTHEDMISSYSSTEYMFSCCFTACSTCPKSLSESINECPGSGNL